MHDSELDSGARVTRRAIIRGTFALPVCIAAGCSAGELGTQAPAPVAQGELSGRPDVASSEAATDPESEFLIRWGTRALDLATSPAPNEDGFLHTLLAEYAAVDATRLPPRIKTSYEHDGLSIGYIAGNVSFQVLEIKLDPLAVIRPHNHVGYCFASLGVRGMALARHFEIFGDAPEPGADLDARFLVHEVSSARLTAGRSTTLTRARANIHGFQAGAEGATIMDFGVQFHEPGPGPKSFSVLEIEAVPDDGLARVYGARWLGNIYAKR